MKRWGGEEANSDTDRPRDFPQAPLQDWSGSLSTELDSVTPELRPAESVGGSVCSLAHDTLLVHLESPPRPHPPAPAVPWHMSPLCSK